MMPYCRINIGDVFASSSPDSNITYTVTDKAGGLIEVMSSYQHRALPKTSWKKPSNTIFRKRILSMEGNSTTIEFERGYAMGHERAEFERGYAKGLSVGRIPS